MPKTSDAVPLISMQAVGVRPNHHLASLVLLEQCYGKPLQKFIYVNLLPIFLSWKLSSHLQRCFSDVTVLLSLTVFLNQVSDSMPNTSDAVPLISISHQLAYSS